MKKIIITEAQTKKLITELFDSGSVYNFKLATKKEIQTDDGYSKTQYKYVFVTKDKLAYYVYLIIREDGFARIDFDVTGHEVYSNLQLINKHDAIKVFNTLKSIILKHKDEIKKLVIHSTEERNKFYKKLLDYMGIKYNSTGSTMIIADINSNPQEIDEIGYNPKKEYQFKDTINRYINKTHLYGQPIDVHLDIPYKNVIYQPDEGSFVLFAYDKDNPVMMCEFNIESDSIEIQGIFADESIRGQEIGIKTYEQLIKNFKLPLISDSGQNQYSRFGIWEKLIKKYPDNITVVDDYGGEERPLKDIGIDNVYDDLRYRLKLYL